jgi:hypothetical protein
MTSLLEEMNEMKSLGYSPLEVEDYKNSQIEEMKTFGFSDEDIYKELNAVHPNTYNNDTVVKEQNKSFWQNVKEKAGAVKEAAVGEEFDINLKSAIGLSLYNLGLQQADKGIPIEEALEVDEDRGFLEQGIESIITLGADLPFYGASILGGTVAAGPAGGVAGLALPPTIRSIFMDQLAESRVQNFSQFWNGWMQEALPEQLRNNPNVLGLLSGSKAIGKGLTEAALLKGTEKATKILDVMNLPKNYWTKFAARWNVFTGLGAALEQHMPTLDDYLSNAVIFKTLGMGESAVTMMKNRTKKTLKNPNEVTKEILDDDIMRAEAISLSHKTFTREKQIDQTQVTDLKSKLTEIKKDKEFLNNPQGNKERLKEYQDIKKQLNDLAEPFEPAQIERTTEIVKDLNVLNKARKKLQSKMSPDKIKRQEVDADPLKSRLQDWSDKLHPILTVSNIGKKIGIKEAENIYQRFRIQPGMIGRAEHMIRYETLDFNSLKGNGKGLMQILEPVIKNEKNYLEFKDYAISRRVIEKEGQDKKTGFDLDSAKIIVKELDGKYKKVFEEYSQYNQRLFKYMKDSGYISKEFYQKALELNKDYVPFHRELDPATTVKAGGRGVSGVKNLMKEFKGSEKRVLDPVETTYLNTYYLVQLAEKNYVRRDLIDVVLDAQKKHGTKLKKIDNDIAKFEKAKETEKDPVRLEKINQAIDVAIARKNELNTAFEYDKIENIKKAETRTTKVQLNKKELEKLDVKDIDTALEKGASIFRKQRAELKDTEMPVYRDGKLEVYEVGPSLAKAVRDVNIESWNMFTKIANIPTRTLRAGATLDPAFTAKNFFRGELAATIFSKNNYFPLVHGSLGVFRLLKGKRKQTELYKDFVKSGALQSSLVSFDRQYIREGFMKEELTSRKVINQINPKNYLEHLRVVSELAESAARISEFKMTQKRLRKTRPELTERQILEQSGFSAREVTLDFQKIGLQMQGVNAITAFYNARLRGYEQLIRGVVKNPTKVIGFLLATQTLPSVLLWMANRDSETYKNLPQYQKDNFHIIIVNEGQDNEIVFRIPKLWELGYVFGTLPEKALTWMDSKDKKAVDEIVKDAGVDLAKFGVGMIPQPEILRVPLELATNKSFFQDRPIIPRRLEGLLPELQQTPYTSEVSKLLGDVFRKIPILDQASSPLQIDYAIKAWTGGLGAYALEGIDYILKKANVTEEYKKPLSDDFVKNLQTMPFIKSFVVRNPTAGAEPLAKFWDKYKVIKQIRDSSDELRRQGKIQESQDILTDEARALGGLDAYAEAIGAYNKLIRGLYLIPKDNKDITQNEIRDYIDKLYEAMILQGKAANKLINEVEKNLKK